MSFLNLDEVEKKAFRTVFEDGLADIYAGLMYLPVSLFMLFGALNYEINVVVFAIPVFASAPILIGIAKMKITVPRMGAVKFGKKVEKRMKMMTTLGIVSFLITLGIVILTTMDAFDGSILFHPFTLFFAQTVFAGFIVGYFLNFNRAYLYGFLYGGPLFLIPVLGSIGVSEIVIHSIPLLSSLTMLSIGLVYLLKFVKKYPVPNQK